MLRPSIQVNYLLIMTSQRFRLGRISSFCWYFFVKYRICCETICCCNKRDFLRFHGRYRSSLAGSYLNLFSLCAFTICISEVFYLCFSWCLKWGTELDCVSFHKVNIKEQLRKPSLIMGLGFIIWFHFFMYVFIYFLATLYGMGFLVPRARIEPVSLAES